MVDCCSVTLSVMRVQDACEVESMVHGLKAGHPTNFSKTFILLFKHMGRTFQAAAGFQDSDISESNRKKKKKRF